MYWGDRPVTAQGNVFCGFVALWVKRSHNIVTGRFMAADADQWREGRESGELDRVSAPGRRSDYSFYC